jgi:hypothetical protein
MAPQYNIGLYSNPVASQGIMSKWFYDTFTDAVTGAARCGSFIEEGFTLLVASYWMNAVDTKIYVVQTAGT